MNAFVGLDAQRKDIGGEVAFIFQMEHQMRRAHELDDDL